MRHQKVYAEYNRLPETIPGYHDSLHTCPVCGGNAYGTTRSRAYGMYCKDCGATWDIREIIVKFTPYMPEERYPDRRRGAYKSGWFEITNLVSPGE